MENKGRPKNFMKTLGRIIKDLFSFYPTLLPITLLFIVINAVVTSIPAIFQQKIISLIETVYKEGSKHNHQTQPKGVIQHNGNYRNHRNQGRNSLRNTDRDKLPHGINVIGIMTHDIPGFVLVEKGNGQILHMIKEFLSILF